VTEAVAESGRVTLLRITGVGAGFVVCIGAGLAAGVWLGSRTGHSWWPIVGLFAGLAAGGIFAASAFRQAMKP
jgi:Putative F0F1-ATPase subunit Ca2+/Mg2+ transporter